MVHAYDRVPAGASATFHARDAHLAPSHLSTSCLAAVDDRRVGHDVDCQSSDGGEADDVVDRKRRTELVAARFRLIAEQRA